MEQKTQKTITIMSMIGLAVFFLITFFIFGFVTVLSGLGAATSPGPDITFDVLNGSLVTFSLWALINGFVIIKYAERIKSGFGKFSLYALPLIVVLIFLGDFDIAARSYKNYSYFITYAVWYSIILAILHWLVSPARSWRKNA